MQFSACSAAAVCMVSFQQRLLFYELEMLPLFASVPQLNQIQLRDTEGGMLHCRFSVTEIKEVNHKC